MANDPLTKQRVRNLNDVQIKHSDFSENKETTVKPKDTSILDDHMGRDLIYDIQAIAEIKARFPEANLEYSYDDVHGERFLVDIPNCSLRTWLKFIISAGMGGISLVCQYTVRKNADAVGEVLNEINPGWRDK